jgi:hypothetical protein
VYDACRGYVGCWQGLAHRSMRVQDLYVGPQEMTFRGLGIWDLGIIGLGFVNLGNWVASFRTVEEMG